MPTTSCHRPCPPTPCCSPVSLRPPTPASWRSRPAHPSLGHLSEWVRERWGDRRPRGSATTPRWRLRARPPIRWAPRNDLDASRTAPRRRDFSVFRPLGVTSSRLPPPRPLPPPPSTSHPLPSPPLPLRPPPHLLSPPLLPPYRCGCRSARMSIRLGGALIKVDALLAGGVRRIQCVMYATCRPAGARRVAVDSDRASTPWHAK